MHAHGILKNIIKKIEEIAASEQTQEVTSISIWCGALSQMTKQHFLEHFEDESRNSIVSVGKIFIEIDQDPLNIYAHEIILKSIDIQKQT